MKIPVSSLDLVYNPVSGSFSQAHLDALVAALRSQGFEVTPLPTTAEGAQFSGDADLICIHGGDGTLRDCVKTLGEDAGRIPLAVAPSGTINLVARELGYPRQPEAFARKLAEGWKRGSESWIHAPLYQLGDMPIVSCLSIGPDSHAVARVSGPLKKRIGRYAYVVAMMQQMREWPRSAMQIRGTAVDGERFECAAEAVIVSSAALYAGPFRLSPQAALAADSVELISLKKSTRLRTIALSLAAMFNLPVARLGIAEVRSVRRVEFDRCVTPVQVDGDHMPDCAWAIGPSGLTLRYVV
ncbi:diacylglycerol kinase family protein [Qipengyuania sp. RANM35]|uniref:diacylglycerol/lipid kinase family protein n=1 Tax=Qipengyuania sp. RANM35 TaxID=3068635 RepID=UPI0034DB3267